MRELIYGAFVERFSDPADALRIGNGFKTGVDQGSLIDGLPIVKAEQHVADALERGLRLAAGGRRHELGGAFLEPTVLTGVTHGMRMTHDETSGPVAPVLSFSIEQDAISLADATEPGLAAYVFARDVGRIWRVGEALEFGVVAVNTGIFSYEAPPLAGVKESGVGRGGSDDVMGEFLEIKYLCMASSGG